MSHHTMVLAGLRGALEQALAVVRAKDVGAPPAEVALDIMALRTEAVGRDAQSTTYRNTITTLAILLEAATPEGALW